MGLLHESRARTSGRVPAWVPLGLALLGLASLMHKLNREVSSHGVALIDTTRYRLHAGDRWMSDAWIERLERLLLRTGELEADDREGILALADELQALPFVAEVGEPRVEWPDGLVIPIRLHSPVACLRVGDDFLPVAEDGTVLAGYSYAPQPAFGGYLPVIGPHGLGSNALDPIQPGDVLGAPAHRDALSVAASMWRYLDRLSLKRLGRVVIDASRERDYRDLPGGVHIDLERTRRIHFGRAPGPDQPGELPVSVKWQHVAEGLARWEGGEDFDALDVRWDEAESLRYDEASGRRR